MITVLMVVLMQAGGAYTHLPKVTLFPKPVAQVEAQPVVTSGPVNVVTTQPMAVAGAPPDRCSARMPRLAIPKDVEFHIGVIQPAVTDQQSIVKPAPECPAPKPQ